MRTILGITGLAALVTAWASVAHAAPMLRVQVDQHGDFLLVGNTLGFDCSAGTPLPVVGTLAPDACQQSATNLGDSSPDVFWSADDPTAGHCLADTTTPASAARSTAVLAVPPGATVTHAFLYWSATNTSGVAGAGVTVERVGAGGFGPTAVAALQSWVPGTDDAYQSVADVTALVQQNGSGAYRVSGIDVAPFAGVDKDVLYGAFWLVAFYQLPGDPLRNLALFDGLDVVKSGSNQSATLSGFVVPNAGFSGKLGVVAFEGDNQATGDALFFNGVQLGNAENPLDNFFNGTRSWLGAPVSVAGDLPQLAGTPQSMGGVDIDVVDITADLAKGQTSAPIKATTTGDTYFLGGFVTSISTFAPDFATSTKTATDVDGGALVPGDVIRYTITASNNGDDGSAQTIVTDPLPVGVSFVPGSINIISGPNVGMKTDAAGDDQGEYVSATRTVVVRLGSGADGTDGGSIAAGADSVFTFDVTVDPGFSGDIANQASVAAGGALGAPVVTVPTDGNGSAAGAPATVVTVGVPTTTSSSGTGGEASTSTSTGTGGAGGSGGSGGTGTGGVSSTGGTSSHGSVTSSGSGSGLVTSGNGLACSVSSGPRDDGFAWVAATALTALAGKRRRRGRRT